MGILDAPAKPYSPRANTVVWIGDSITGNGDGPGSPGTGIANVSYHPRGFWVHAQSLLGHRLRTIANKGVGGERSDQILARLQTDVIASKPGWCHVHAGTNDVSQMGATQLDGSTITLATVKANLTAIWDALDRVGIRVIAGTLTPRGSYTGTQLADTTALNLWIKDQGRRRSNLIVVDYFSALASQAGGSSAGTYDNAVTPALNFDVLHPSSNGAFLMGQLLAKRLDPLIPANLELSNSETDAGNLIQVMNRFGGGSNTAPAGTGYSNHLLAGATYAKVPRTDGINGNWQQFTVPTGAGSSFIQYNVNIGATVAVGDVVSAAVEYQISNLDAAAAVTTRGFYMRLQSYNGTSATDMVYDHYFVQGSTENMSAAARSGVLRTPPIAVPAGTTILLLLIHMDGGGTYQLDRVTMLNHTKQALAG